MVNFARAPSAGASATHVENTSVSLWSGWIALNLPESLVTLTTQHAGSPPLVTPVYARPDILSIIVTYPPQNP